MKKHFFLLMAFGALSLVSCKKETEVTTTTELNEGNVEVQKGYNTTDTTYTSNTATDFFGTYKGVFPCADCPGIEHTLVLEEGDKFTLDLKYQEKGNGKVNTQNGTFTLEDDILSLPTADGTLKFKIKGHEILQLDMNGKEITGPLADNYILKKQ